MGHTYICRKTNNIYYKVIKIANIGISYRLNNAIEKLLGRNNQKHDKYDNAGVYKLNCKDCNEYYIGKAGRNFKIRYKGLVRDIKNYRDNIGYAEHILNTRYSYGTIKDTMEIIKTIKKGLIMDTVKRPHIQSISK
jgi:hypothetical protein